ncbi:hypothetical protein CVT26_013461 [Gymnopilus dilepis]|uniref:Uncharacterized protein n=1 Tax=Gymnopilus dilepis TaxID=231916 RepID=A0A409YWX5_9AGAR|nr:hypothetical protein CVT26_013461 [Gymnopilus dilepis]
MCFKVWSLLTRSFRDASYLFTTTSPPHYHPLSSPLPLSGAAASPSPLVRDAGGLSTWEWAVKRGETLAVGDPPGTYERAQLSSLFPSFLFFSFLFFRALKNLLGSLCILAPPLRCCGPSPVPPSLQTRSGGTSATARSIHSSWGGFRVSGARQRECEGWRTFSWPWNPDTDRPPPLVARSSRGGWSPINFEQGEPLLGVSASTPRA